jgi:hypothetical protein
MCWHKWSKWKFYDLFWKKTATDKLVCIERRQKRECIKCGKTQDELVSYS